MKLVVASTFRDATPYLDRYLSQAAELLCAAERQGDTVEFLWCENDSVDATLDRLKQVRGDVTIVEHHTGAPYYPSVDIPERWANIAEFSNALLDHLPVTFDVLVWVESDLIWEPSTILKIAGGALKWGVVAAPMWQGDRFYDIWTTQRDGETFIPPRHSGLVHADSTAGAVAVHAPLARVCRFPKEDACRGWTRSMGGVWLDTDVEVQHP